jgi:hypothetical protein
MSNDEKKSTHFSDSSHQECMVFARIGHGSCYHHWNEIFAGVNCLPQRKVLDICTQIIVVI